MENHKIEVYSKKLRTCGIRIYFVVFHIYYIFCLRVNMTDGKKDLLININNFSMQNVTGFCTVI